jgi:hypothetical protein
VSAEGQIENQLAHPVGPLMIIREGGVVYLEIGEYVSVPLSQEEACRVAEALNIAADTIDPEGSETDEKTS